MSQQLTVIRGSDQGRTFELQPGQTIRIGRGGDCELRLSDPHASRLHCRVEATIDGATLIDEHSSYGTLVAGEKIATRPLRTGDVFRVGETEIRYLAGAAASETIPPDRGSDSQGEIPVRRSGVLESLVGQTLARYEIREMLAKGRSGLVFKAFDPEKQRTVALKVLWPELSAQEEEVQRFIRAVKTMLPIHHDNLVTIYRAGKTGPHCWMAMEYVEGESLAKVIDRIGIGGMLDWTQGFRVAMHVGRALEVAHENKIIHRNITPTNILLRKSDNVVKLGDLILAKALEGTLAATITRAGELLGELIYMSPELTTGQSDVDIRSDIYSLGATVYRLVCGSAPFEGKTPAETIRKIQSDDLVRPTKHQLSIPPLFEGVITQMLQRNPNDRFQTPTHLIRELNRVAKFQGVEGV